MLKHNLDFVLELGVLQEPRLCVKPVYKFIKAFAADENIPEFCLIYSEADDPDEIFVSVNSRKFEKILREYKNREIVFHGENGAGGLRESFYYNRQCRETAGPGIRACARSQILTRRAIEAAPYVRLLTLEDKRLAEFQDNDNYLNIIFDDFTVRKIYHDCGIIGAFDENNNFTGYLAYYEIAENIRDVSYIYISEEYRGRGFGKKLLNFFVNKNTEENKISYYSYATGEASEKLAKSCGFLSCAKRYEERKL